MVAKHTIELILESSSTCKLLPFHLSARQDYLQREIQSIISQNIKRHATIEQSFDTVLRPPDLGFQCVNRKRRRVKQRWRGASGDIVADKGEAVDKDRKTENHRKCADAEYLVSFVPSW